MEGHVKGGTLKKLVERLTHHSINGDHPSFQLDKLILVSDPFWLF